MAGVEEAQKNENHKIVCGMVYFFGGTTETWV